MSRKQSTPEPARNALIDAELAIEGHKYYDKMWSQPIKFTPAHTPHDVTVPEPHIEDQAKKLDDVIDDEAVFDVVDYGVAGWSEPKKKPAQHMDTNPFLTPAASPSPHPAASSSSPENQNRDIVHFVLCPSQPVQGTFLDQIRLIEALESARSIWIIGAGVSKNVDVWPEDHVAGDFNLGDGTVRRRVQAHYEQAQRELTAFHCMLAKQARLHPEIKIFSQNLDGLELDFPSLANCKGLTLIEGSVAHLECSHCGMLVQKAKHEQTEKMACPSSKFCQGQMEPALVDWSPSGGMLHHGRSQKVIQRMGTVLEEDNFEAVFVVGTSLRVAETHGFVERLRQKSNLREGGRAEATFVHVSDKAPAAHLLHLFDMYITEGAYEFQWSTRRGYLDRRPEFPLELE